LIFTSREFLIFFPIVCGLFFISPHQRRWVVLLAASYFFYMWWRWEYFVLLLTTTSIAYVTAIAIERQTDPKRKRQIFIAGIVGVLAGLIVFKYTGFLTESINQLLSISETNHQFPILELILPVGISFYTFQTLSYTIDVYRGQRKAERNFGIFSLYVSFFPQLVAGPIERSTNLLPQFRKQVDFESARVISGFRLILWGFFKKLVIADNIAPVVDHVYQNPTAYHGLPLIVATLFFAVQIYCDFSGYASIAIGIARVFGIDLMENFKMPYGATSIKEFWHRWHISLSSWFRDYVYIPLGGNKSGSINFSINILIVFLVSGLWHGANWTFVAWGGIHGMALLAQVWTASVSSKAFDQEALPLPDFLKAIFVQGFVCFAWIFFRAENLTDTQYVVENLFVGVSHQILDLNFWRDFLDRARIPTHTFVIVSMLSTALYIQHIFAKETTMNYIERVPRPARWAAYFGMIYSILFVGQVDEQAFIYFQF
jgi:alginate O-acetyltransferase complex protein AlgI